MPKKLLSPSRGREFEIFRQFLRLNSRVALLRALAAFFYIFVGIAILVTSVRAQELFEAPASDLPAPISINQQATTPSATASVAPSSFPANEPPLGPGRIAFAGSTGKPSTNTPPYKILRYDEDYAYLRDAARRTDWLDPLKYTPLFGEDDCYLTLGGDVREWFESYHNDGFGAAPSNAQGNNTYFLQRYMLHADIHLGSDWRVFVQSVSGLEDGRIGGPRPDIDVNTFDAHQGFVDWKWHLGDQDSVTWRVGRQEFRYGSGRLIDVREGPNLRLSFDAARMLATVGDWSVDAWWGKPVQNNPGVFDDHSDPDVSFWGLYAVRPIGDGNHANVDAYYIGFDNLQAEFNEKSGRELRHSVGTRLWARPKPWEYNLEYVYQFGDFGTGRISAWTAANALRYNFDDIPWKPSTGIRFDLASGDRNANSANINTFNPLFPSGAYFNLAGPFGPMNMIDLHPTLDLHVSEDVTLSADWNFFWRESLDDGVYRLSGSEIASGQSSQSRYIGSSPAMTLVWTPRRHVTVLMSYVHIFPGPFLIEATPGQPLDYLTTWLTYKF